MRRGSTPPQAAAVRARGPGSPAQGRAEHPAASKERGWLAGNAKRYRSGRRWQRLQWRRRESHRLEQRQEAYRQAVAVLAPAAAPAAAVEGPSHVPADVGNGNDDDIVARQLREAAMKERDPQLQEKLWQEYRDYKKDAK